MFNGYAEYFAKENMVSRYKVLVDCSVEIPSYSERIISLSDFDEEFNDGLHYFNKGDHVHTKRVKDEAKVWGCELPSIPTHRVVGGWKCDRGWQRFGNTPEDLVPPALYSEDGKKRLIKEEEAASVVSKLSGQLTFATFHKIFFCEAISDEEQKQQLLREFISRLNSRLNDSDNYN